MKRARVDTVSATSVVRTLAVGASAVGTHDGSFHCDEALACGLLRLLPAFSDYHVLRSRDPDKLEGCSVVVDVGGVYDPERNRFDHHQREFSQSLAEYGFKTKLSSAGLVYKHYGMAVLEELTKADDLPKETLNVLYSKVYRNFIEHVDGIDNGINAREGDENYQVTTTLSARVGRLNPSWNEVVSPEEEDARFLTAMELTVRAAASLDPDWSSTESMR